jgi:Beta-lactamase class C and other penicillin binding proteins
MSVRAAKPDNARSITRNLRNLPVAAPIRSRYIYCNMMYTVATHLVEVKSGQDFGTFLEERFFKPLDMASTTLQPSSARSKGLNPAWQLATHGKEPTQTYRGLRKSRLPRRPRRRVYHFERERLYQICQGFSQSRRAYYKMLYRAHSPANFCRIQTRKTKAAHLTGSICCWPGYLLL